MFKCVSPDLPTDVQKHTNEYTSSPELFSNNFISKSQKSHKVFNENESELHNSTASLHSMINNIGHAIMDGN